MVAQIVFLPNPDQFGRGGRYLAHSLIFAPEALVHFEADPFRLFQQFSFVSTVDQALGRGNFQTGDIPTMSLELPPSLSGEIQAAGQWSIPELKKLALLALRAEQAAHTRETVTFTGTSDQIEQALEAAFLTVPVSRRVHCSFDTYFHRCNLAATYFWAIGLPEPPISIKFALVDGSARQVQSEIIPQPETAYERWVMQTIEAGQLDELTHYRDNAFAVAEWLDGRPYDLSLQAAAPTEVITAVFKTNPQAVRTLLHHQVSEKLPAELVHRAAEQIRGQATAADLYRMLSHSFEPAELLDILYESYVAEKFGKPSGREIKALAELLRTTTQHPMLNLFVAYWNSPHRQLPIALERASQADYRQFAEIALELKLLKPVSLLVPGRADIFLDLYPVRDGEEVLELVERLIETEETAYLSRLVDGVSQLSGKELKKLARLVDEEPNIPEPYRLAVEQATAAQPPKRGIKDTLQSIWRR